MSNSYNQYMMEALDLAIDYLNVAKNNSAVLTEVLEMVRVCLWLWYCVNQSLSLFTIERYSITV